MGAAVQRTGIFVPSGLPITHSSRGPIHPSEWTVSEADPRSLPASHHLFGISAIARNATPPVYPRAVRAALAVSSSPYRLTARILTSGASAMVITGTCSIRASRVRRPSSRAPEPPEAFDQPVAGGEPAGPAADDHSSRPPIPRSDRGRQAPPGDVSFLAADGRSAVGNRIFLSIPGEQQRVVCQTYDDTLTKDALTGFSTSRRVSWLMIRKTSAMGLPRASSWATR